MLYGRGVRLGCSVALLPAILCLAVSAHQRTFQLYHAISLGEIFGFIFSPPFLKGKNTSWSSGIIAIFFPHGSCLLSTLLLLRKQIFIPSSALQCERRTPSANLHLSEHLSEQRIKVLLCKMAPVAVLINTCLMDCLPGVFQAHHFSC